MLEHINNKYFPALYVCVCYLCLVFAASAFKCLVAEVGYGNEITEITHVDFDMGQTPKTASPSGTGQLRGQSDNLAPSHQNVTLHLCKN